MALNSGYNKKDSEEIIYGRYIVEISIVKGQGFTLLCFSFKNKVCSSLGHLKIKILDSGDINFLDGNLGNKDTFLEFVNKYLLEKYPNNSGSESIINDIKLKVENNH